MRLALALECPLHQQGGVEVLVRTLIEDLHERFELFLVSDELWDSLRVSAHGRMLRGHFQWKTTDHGPAQIDRLIDWGGENRIDLFHFHMGGTFHWCARSWNHCAITRISQAGFRCLSTNHQAVWPFDGKIRDQHAIRRIAAFATKWPGKARQLTAVEHEILVSNHDLAIQRRYFPLHARKFRRLYHSRLSSAAAVCDYDPESRIILNLATIAFRKGQHILAEAFARIAGDFPEWQLHLVGNISEPACSEHIQKSASGEGLAGRIHMPGPTDDPVGAIAGCGIYVQPSLLEGLGLSLQEALFHGRPCVGSRVGGIPELIEHETSGLLVPPGNPAKLAEVLAELMRSPEQRIRFAGDARQHMLRMRMTRENMLEEHLRIYEVMH